MRSGTEPKDQSHGRTYGDELPVGSELLRGQYRIERFLNSGGFGITYLARNSLDRIVVIKECFPGFFCCRSGNEVRVRSDAHAKDYQTLIDLFRTEARSLAMLEHPNIVRVHEVFSDNNTAYMALDFVEGRDLHTLIAEDGEQMGATEVRDLLMSLLTAVAHVHARGILHRDISPDNILIERNGNPVLIDFGAARAEAARGPRGASALQAVKDGYSPHEFYSRSRTHSAASDLYGLAATFHFVITGEAPPPSQDRLAAIAEHMPDPYRRLEGRVARFDRPFLAAIDRSLQVLSRDRMQSAQEWLLQIDDQSRYSEALATARADARIDHLVSQLVAQTNVELEKSLAEERERESEEARLRDEEAERKRIKDERRRLELEEQERRDAEEAAARRPGSLSEWEEDYERGRVPMASAEVPALRPEIDYYTIVSRKSKDRTEDPEEKLRTEAAEAPRSRKSLLGLGPRNPETRLH
ncbi:serine/threonine-protein kinase [Tropicimonas aquimaris]|uniref:Serine/threonine-protein kinase n=1 Tax=Tropicimonas aquimaris TaxID=914152 RepID=A0ABW3IT90_9RHOB